MVIFKKSSAVARAGKKMAGRGMLTGFVPTMGALHDGHQALIRRARQSCDWVTCSIFVNPTQFNDPEDFRKYPITLEADILKLTESGADCLFLPSVEEMYPEGTRQLPEYDLGHLGLVLEAVHRPGHFQGVCTIVHRLLEAVKPDQLFMGQKDYQQCMVVQKMLAITGLSTELVICPTIREPGGLAKSSRNMRLSESEREQATIIYQTLLYIRETIREGKLQPLKSAARARLEAAGYSVDYVDIADQHTLEIVETWNGRQPLVALVAAFVGPVRLIDNLLL